MLTVRNQPVLILLRRIQQRVDEEIGDVPAVPLCVRR